jgi:hypothetical protein
VDRISGDARRGGFNELEVYGRHAVGKAELIVNGLETKASFEIDRMSLGNLVILLQPLITPRAAGYGNGNKATAEDG